MNPIRIGQLRFQLNIYQRSDAPDTESMGIVETDTLVATVAGDVQPVGSMTFFGSINADFDKPVTHRAIVRWLPLADLNYLITRTLNTPDGQTRTENFRVWRLQEVEGRQRFVIFDCQLETVTYA